MEREAYNSVGINRVRTKNKPIKWRMNIARKKPTYQAYDGFLLEFLCVWKITCFFNYFSSPNKKYTLYKLFLLPP